MRRDWSCWLAATVISLTVISANAMADDTYHAEIKAWRKAHEAKLRAPDGWLSVSGLHWLNPGQTRLGSDPSNDILLPAHAPAMLGTLELNDRQQATFTLAPGVSVLRNGKTFSGGEIHSDHDPRPDILAIGDLKLLLIERGHRLAFRVKDNQSPFRANFAGLKWYPVRDDWRIKARFVPYDTPTTITMDTIIGQSESSPSPGYVEFEHDGKTIKLQANEARNGALWFVFRDKTSGRTTHGGARQLDAPKPENGTVILDFNKAVNLPCAYIPYATCPLAPPQNRMSVAVEAGELKYEQPSIAKAASN
jgi:uncharacterized protein (DUF1684 family)